MNPEQEARYRIQEFLEICRDADYTKAAPYLIYRGEDASRRLKDLCRAADAEDMKYVQGMVNRVKKWVDESENYKLISCMTSEESEGTWYAWEVIFAMGPDQVRRYFGCLKVGGNFAIGDIDR